MGQETCTVHVHVHVHVYIVRYPLFRDISTVKHIPLGEGKCASFLVRPVTKKNE